MKMKIEHLFKMLKKLLKKTMIFIQKKKQDKNTYLGDTYDK